MHCHVILAMFLTCCVICLCVKVNIAMICRDLCDFLTTRNNEFAISIHSLSIVNVNFFLHFLRRQNFAAVNPDHNDIYGGIAECRRKFRGLCYHFFLLLITWYAFIFFVVFLLLAGMILLSLFYF